MSPTRLLSAVFTLYQLSSKEEGEREWACRSVAHLVSEPDAQPTLLNHQGLPRSLIPLLLDRGYGVREAAAGALRYRVENIFSNGVCMNMFLLLLSLIVSLGI